MKKKKKRIIISVAQRMSGLLLKGKKNRTQEDIQKIIRRYKLNEIGQGLIKFFFNQLEGAGDCCIRIFDGEFQGYCHEDWYRKHFSKRCLIRVKSVFIEVVE